MDLAKIGSYIAGKRKELGMTQKQLAEKIGMSDKSVSKWERGICLPDVSVYMELCEILGISINEFLAGEDIRVEDMVKKSEDNLIGVSRDSVKKQRSLKKIIAGLTVLAVLITGVLGTVIYNLAFKPQNYFIAVDNNSAEGKIADMLTGVNGAYMFRYKTSGKYKKLTLGMKEYKEGKFVQISDFVMHGDVDFSDESMTEAFTDADFWDESMTEELNDNADDAYAMSASYSAASISEGMIMIVPDFNNFTLRIVVSDDDGWISTDLPILEEEENREDFGRGGSYTEGKQQIHSGEEQELMTFICSESGMIMEPNGPSPENDYTYIFTLKFE